MNRPYEDISRTYEAVSRPPTFGLQYQLMPTNHRPNSLRQPAADYSDPGAYFVTVCTYHHQALFGQVMSGTLLGNQFSEIVWEVWRSLPRRFSQISVDAAVVMPDHFHGIIVLHEGTAAERKSGLGSPPPDELGVPAPTHARRTMTLSLVMGYFKMNSAKRINLLRDTPRDHVWQRGYYDRILRPGREYPAAVEYILTNPQRWKEDMAPDF